MGNAQSSSVGQESVENLGFTVHRKPDGSPYLARDAVGFTTCKVKQCNGHHSSMKDTDPMYLVDEGKEVVEALITVGWNYSPKGKLGQSVKDGTFQKSEMEAFAREWANHIILGYDLSPKARELEVKVANVLGDKSKINRKNDPITKAAQAFLLRKGVFVEGYQMPCCKDRRDCIDCISKFREAGRIWVWESSRDFITGSVQSFRSGINTAGLQHNFAHGGSEQESIEEDLVQSTVETVRSVSAPSVRPENRPIRGLENINHDNNQSCTTEGYINTGCLLAAILYAAVSVATAFGTAMGVALVAASAALSAAAVKDQAGRLLDNSDDNIDQGEVCGGSVEKDTDDMPNLLDTLPGEDRVHFPGLTLEDEVYYGGVEKVSDDGNYSWDLTEEERELYGSSVEEINNDSTYSWGTLPDDLTLEHELDGSGVERVSDDFAGFFDTSSDSDSN